MNLNLTLAVETIVLLATLFFIIYVNRNQLSRWYRYAGIAILIFIIGLMLCTMVSSCYMCYKPQMGSCEMDANGMKCMDGQMQGDCCEQMGNTNGGMGCANGHGMQMNKSCGKNMSSCHMMEKKDDCCEGMDEKACDSEGDKEECIRKCEGDSLVKKEVIIKKK